MLRDSIGRLQDKRHFFTWRDICLTPQIASLSNQGILGIHHFDVAMIQSVVAAKVLIEWLGPAREHDGLASLICGHIKIETHTVPKFFANEWQKRMKQQKG